MSWGRDGGILLVCVRVQQLPFVMAAVTALDFAMRLSSRKAPGAEGWISISSLGQKDALQAVFSLYAAFNKI